MAVRALLHNTIQRFLRGPMYFGHVAAELPTSAENICLQVKPDCTLIYDAFYGSWSMSLFYVFWRLSSQIQLQAISSTGIINAHHAAAACPCSSPEPVQNHHRRQQGP